MKWRAGRKRVATCSVIDRARATSPASTTSASLCFLALSFAFVGHRSLDLTSNFSTPVSERPWQDGDCLRCKAGAKHRCEQADFPRAFSWILHADPNLRTDKALLLSLGLNGPMIAKPQTPVRAKKTKARPSLAASVSPSQESVSSTGPTRRSARFQKKDDDAAYEEEEEEDDFTEEEEEEEEDRPRASRKRSAPRPSTWSAASAAAAAKRRRAALPGGVARKVQSLVYNGRPNTKIFGHQVGTEVGDTWDSRMLCSQAGVHGPPVGGIHGHQTEGCWSVALSGGYEDDVDLGCVWSGSSWFLALIPLCCRYGFTYTGSGGRDLKGTKNDPKNLRSAPQSFDQEFTGFNLSLKVSVETRNPVRVIRGFKNHSCFAPETGYRYDGLYTVEKAWSEVGQAGHLVCRVRPPLRSPQHISS